MNVFGWMAEVRLTRMRFNWGDVIFLFKYVKKIVLGSDLTILNTKMLYLTDGLKTTDDNEVLLFFNCLYWSGNTIPFWTFLSLLIVTQTVRGLIVAE